MSSLYVYFCPHILQLYHRLTLRLSYVYIEQFSNSTLIYRIVYLPHAMLAQIEMFALIQKHECIRIVNRRLWRDRIDRFQYFIYSMQNLQHRYRRLLLKSVKILKEIKFLKESRILIL